MSTRGVVARQTGGRCEFRGSYLHYDNYPSGAGATLWHLINKYGAKAVAEFLIDQHPAGWSTINDADTEQPSVESAMSKCECFCHSRHEKYDETSFLTHETAQACGCEYAYILNGEDDSLIILSSYCDPDGQFVGQKMIGAFGMGDVKATWRYVTTLYPTDDKEPDWKQLNELARRDYGDKTDQT